MLAVNALLDGLELSFTLYFLYNGTIYSDSKCTAWIAVDYILFSWSIYAMFWTSLERYLFIYHQQLVKRHPIALHYGPIGFVGIYCPVLYVGLIILYPCEPAYDVRLYICGSPCYTSDPVAGLTDWIVNGICPESFVLIVDVAVIVRHLLQRRRMKSVILTVNARRQSVRHESSPVLRRVDIVFVIF